MASIIASLNCLSTKRRTDPGAFSSKCFFTRGENTWDVPLGLHETNRANFVGRFSGRGCALFRGGASVERNDTDHEGVFRQESYFQYLFGVKEPGWWGVIDMRSGEATLYAPRLGPEYAVWMGHIESCEELSQRYGITVCCIDELRLPEKIYLLNGVNSDSGINIADVLPVRAALPTSAQEDFDKATVDDSPSLYTALAESRVHKSPEEIELLRYVAYVSSMAHVEVMRSVKPGDYEYQLEARFLAACAESGGCRNCAYTSICACGPNSAVLHYGHAGAPNERQMGIKDMALLDMGAEYHCYCSDITCSFPVSGAFDAEQRVVYVAVLDAQRRVISTMKPGVSWSDCHLVAERAILEHLQRAGVLVGDVDEMVALNIGAVFLPCGLGHFIGLDTHDVGGYLPDNPPRATRDGLKKLRTARRLEKGMVLTVEPGCYFIDALLDPAVNDPKLKPFFNQERLNKFRGFGGIRLEDVVAVTSRGVENYTLCPRTVREVENVMQGGDWPPAVDTAPWLQRKWATLQDSQFTPLNVPFGA